MPRPVDALPCGSRSITSVGSPTAASAVPRLIAVVVLPTPPFWLATTRTRGRLTVFRLLAGSDICDAPDFENDPIRVRQACVPDRLNLPRCAGFGQFGLYILALEKQAYRLRGLKRPCITQQFGQRRAGPRGDEVERLPP